MYAKDYPAGTVLYGTESNSYWMVTHSKALVSLSTGYADSANPWIIGEVLKSGTKITLEVE